jgi:hypothetical protein
VRLSEDADRLVTDIVSLLGRELDDQRVSANGSATALAAAARNETHQQDCSHTRLLVFATAS